MNKKKQTAVLYMLAGLCFLALPTYAKHYKGNTGKLLVAAPGLQAPFNQSVVFIARQNLFYAWGVIINRPFAWKSGKMKSPAYFGGPVEDGCSAHIIGRRDDGSLLIAAADDKTAGPIKDKRVVLGCAGWGPFQLNLEMAGGGWGVIDYDPELVFNTPADKIWDIAHNRALQDSVIKKKKLPDQYVRKK